MLLDSDKALNEINPLPDSSLESGSFGAILTGLIGKAGVSYIDSQFPSGNQPAAAVNQKAISDANNAALAKATAPIDYKPYIIGGGIILGVLVIVIAIRK